MRHYERVISGCCFLFIFVNVGLSSTSFGVYQPYLAALPGVGDGGASLVLSVRTLVTLGAMFCVNWWYNRVDCRIGIGVACLFTAVGFTLYGLASSLGGLCVGAVFCGLGYGLGGIVGMTLLTGRWYHDHVGTAVGFATLGSGVAGMLMPAVCHALIAGVSLSFSFLVEAGVAAAVGVLQLVVLRNRPSEMHGLIHHHDKDNKRIVARVARKHARRSARALLVAQDPVSPRAHALLVLASFFVGMVSIGGLAYMSILFTSNGYEEGFAALMLSVCGVALAASKFGTGELFDHIGTPRGTAFIFATLVVALVLCCLAPLGNLAVAVAAAVCFGIGGAVGSVGISVWSLELSCAATRASTVKNMQVGYAAGGFLADTFPGFLAQACGSYVPTYAILAATTAAAGVLVLLVYRRCRSGKDEGARADDATSACPDKGAGEGASAHANEGKAAAAGTGAPAQR